ncbi:hypothetical protein KHF85_03120 [Xanthomonas translucens pv. graminis]|nr:hypothetical protein [Xanthomonas translucens]WIH05507.1 hypothetical protein KHF85_03120 [Xanthomonas translucens pv. graminis]
MSALDPDYPLPAAVSDGQGEVGSASLPDRQPLEVLREGLQLGQRDGLAALARLREANLPAATPMRFAA